MATQEGGALDAFQRERSRLFGIAYRMLGSVREAEDVLQEAYLRWHGVDHGGVESPPAYLARLVGRLCLDALKSAHRRRMEYVGVWLPEPLVQGVADDPATLGERSDDLSLAFLLLLERLSPVERAVFLLRESFDFPYREIAEVVGKTEANCRQIERRARRRLADSGRPLPTDPAEHDRLLARFLQATREGDVQALLEVLAEDAVAYSDGGGRVTAALRPVVGAERVARFVLGVAGKVPPGWESVPVVVNGRTGVLGRVAGRLHSVLALHVDGGRIHTLFVTLNPDKLPP